jgi:hypothetical protein
MNTQPEIRFAAIGLNHGHIYGQVGLMLRAGATLVSYYAVEPELAAEFGGRFPWARLARSPQESTWSCQPGSRTSGLRWGSRLCSTARIT